VTTQIHCSIRWKKQNYSGKTGSEMRGPCKRFEKYTNVNTSSTRNYDKEI